MKGIIALVSGLLFALGLGISGMTQTAVVRGFLDFTGNWNWKLMGVMIGAIGVHAITYQIIKKRSGPILEERFQMPTKKDLDARLIIGAAIFGLGWGIAGICPGPGIVSLISGESSVIYFIVSMLGGMFVFYLLERFVWNKA